jgi:hypothetical protein
MAACLIRGCGSFAAAENNVCDTCWQNRTATLAALPELWLRLHAQLPPGAKKLAEAISRPAPGPKSPIQVCVLDTLRSAPHALMEWAILCIDKPVPTEGKRWGYLMGQAVTLLAANDERWRHQPEALGYVSAIVYWHRKMAALLGLHETLLHLPIDCPECERRSVYWVKARQVVACSYSGCATQWPEGHWAEYVAGAAKKRRG